MIIFMILTNKLQMIKRNRQTRIFWTGALIASIFSIIGSITTLAIQHIFDKKEKEIQLFIDEKKDFVLACNEYLKQYRDWHELMNYFVYADTTANFISEFDNKEQAISKYRKWKKDFDLAYGTIYMLSNNEFGLRTMEVSTVLHIALQKIISKEYDSTSKREAVLKEVDDYFFTKWLQKAQEEIFRYNSGVRYQKSDKEFLTERKLANEKVYLNDSTADIYSLFPDDSTYINKHK